MPQAIAAVGAWLAAAGPAASFVITLAANVVLGAISRKLAGDQDEPGRNPEREVTVRAADAYEYWCYGRAMLGGLTVYNNATYARGDSTRLDRMYHIVKYTCHPVNCMELFRFDDRNVYVGSETIDWAPATYTGCGHVTTGHFADVLALRWYDGNQTIPDSIAIGELNTSDWNADFVGKDLSYLIFEVAQNDDGSTEAAFEGGFPNNLSAYIHGKSVFDPRKSQLNYDPDFAHVESYWSTNGNDQETYVDSMGLNTGGWDVRSGIGGVGNYGIIIPQSRGTTNYLYSEPIPINANSVYTMSFLAKRHTVTSGQMIPSVQFLDGDKKVIHTNSSDATGWSLFSYWHQWPSQNTAPLDVFSRHNLNMGSGEMVSIPSCASFARIGLYGVRSASLVRLQDMRLFEGTTRHFQTADSTYEYSESPPLCVADYLMNERFGYGKNLRIPINAARTSYSRDPYFRSADVLDTYSMYTTNPQSGFLGRVNGVYSGQFFLGNPSSYSDNPGLYCVVPPSPSVPYRQFFTYPQAIDPSGRYEAICKLRQVSGPGRIAWVFAFLDGNGDLIHTASSDATGWEMTNGNYHAYDEGAGGGGIWFTPPSVSSEFLITFGHSSSLSDATIPSCAQFVSVGLFAVASVSGIDVNTSIQHFSYMGFRDFHFPKTVEPYQMIDWASVRSAAAYCDELVATPSGFQARFACNGAGTTGQTHRDNIQAILQSFNGRLSMAQSGFSVQAGWQEPVRTVSKRDMVRSLKIKTAYDIEDRFNTVRGTFWDPEQEFTEVPFPTVTADEYLARDGDKQLYQDLHLRFTNDLYMAQRVGFAMLEQGDNQQSVEVDLTHAAFGLIPGNHMAIDYDPIWPGGAKDFLIAETKLDPKRGVVLTAREDFQASYVDPSTTDYSSITTPIGVYSNAGLPPTVTSLTAVSRTEGVQLRWFNPSARLYDYIDIYYNATGTWSDGVTKLGSTADNEFFDAINDYTNPRYYWAVTRDYRNFVSSVYPDYASTLRAEALPGVARDPQYVFSEEFRYTGEDDFNQRWTRIAYSGSLVFTQSGQYGGYAMHNESGGYHGYHKDLIPFDETAIYEFSFRTKRLTAASSGSPFMWAGLVMYRADGATPIDAQSNANALTNQYYAALLNANSIGSGWQEYKGYITGTMPWPQSGTISNVFYQRPPEIRLAARLHPLTRFIRPLIQIGVVTDNEQMMDYVRIRKITDLWRDNAVRDPYMLQDSGWNNNPTDGGTNSMNVVSYCVAPVRVAIQSEFNSIPFTRLNGSADHVDIIMFPDPERDLRVPIQNSFSIRWNAKVLCGTGTLAGTYPKLQPLWYYYRPSDYYKRVSNLSLGAHTVDTNFEKHQWSDIGGRLGSSVSSFSGFNDLRLAFGLRLSGIGSGSGLGNSFYLTYLSAKIEIGT